MARYYVIERPIAQGAHPRGAASAQSWLPPRQTGQGFAAYGYVDYNRPLTFAACERYGLVPDDQAERDRHEAMREAVW